MTAVARAGAGLVLLVMWGLGVFQSVTAWIPHAGHHGHAPGTAGYIGLYGLLVLLAPMALYVVVWAFLIPLEWI